MNERGFVTLVSGLAILSGALGVALIAKGLWDGHTIKTLRAELSAERDNAERWKAAATAAVASAAAHYEANSTNLRTIDDLAARLKAEVGRAQELDALLARARADNARSLRAIELAHAELDRRKEMIFEQDHHCRAWGDRPVCSAISRSVLEQYEAAGDLGRRSADQADRRAAPPAGGDSAGDDARAGPAASAEAGVFR